MTTDFAIETRGLSKHYRVGRRAIIALEGLTLSVARGEVFGLLGPNGAGKSTTIKLLLDLIKPTAGEALVFGRSPRDSEGRRTIGFLPENPAPYEYLTGEEFLSLAARLSGLSAAESKTRVGELLVRVGMAKASNIIIRRYSKGMVQRIALAWALVGKPSLLILDEPTSGLDVLGRQLVRELILEERQRGTTILFCSHIIPDVERLCDRVALLVGGKLIKQGQVSELLVSEGALMEATVESITLEALKALGLEARAAGSRVVVCFDPAKTQEVLTQMMGAGARVCELTPARYSLEQLFVDAVTHTGVEERP
ncbi:MAG: ABC transporter ATP-binding protein [Myxococcales bacterium]|nr:ABC transporter ATP-binding protein [Myxococcales bacterium]